MYKGTATSKLETILKGLRPKWYRVLWRNIHQTYRNIRRVVLAAPMIYNSQDWDYVYLVEVMVWKMKDLEQCIEEDTYNVNRKKQLKSIRTARILGERILSGKCDYSDVRSNCTRISNTSNVTIWRHKAAELEWQLFMKILNKHMRGWWT